MTQQKDIYTKYMIEYDKANVTSSYPSYTPYEIATFLNKALLALISQKVTGNNVRRVPFEGDTKAISDIQPLLTTQSIEVQGTDDTAINSKKYNLPNNFLYYVTGLVKVNIGNNKTVDAPVELVSHEVAQKFKQTLSNRPWIKNTVAYIEGNKIIILYDNYEEEDSTRIDANLNRVSKTPGNFVITYIKMPTLFDGATITTSTTAFELNDSMAEELVSLAVTMSLENIESQRLQTSAQIRGLEA